MEDQVQTATQPEMPVDKPVSDWLKFDTAFDFKGTRKYDELAAVLPVGASKALPTREEANKLVAAIERKHGKRTASVFLVDKMFRVQRTEQKAERKIVRKPKAPVEGSTDKKSTTKKGGK